MALIYSTHEGYMREGGSNVDSGQRMQWALSVLKGRGKSLHLDKLAACEVIAQVHDSEYLHGLAVQASTQPAMLSCDMYFDEELWQVARHACGALTHMTQLALDNPENVYLALSRPGSHHAGPDYAMGSCLINNLAVAAQSAIAAGVAKVAVVDFDIHHGNGTQEVFYDRGDVLTASMHQYPFFPGTGATHEIGQGAGVGANINCHITERDSPQEIVHVYERMLKAVRQYKPGLLLMEAGLDGHILDDSANTQMTDDVFYQIGVLTRSLIDDIECSTVLELGGGYEQESLQSGLGAFLTGMGF